MAKQCAFCKKMYPENLRACPYCHGPNVPAPAMPAEEEAIDLSPASPDPASDSSPSDQALQALLADSGADVLEVLPEEGSGVRRRPPTDLDIDGGILDITAEDSAPRQRPATDVHMPRGVIDVTGSDTGVRKRPATDVDIDIHEVLEDVREEGSGARQRPPTGVDLHATVEDIIEVMPESTVSAQPSTAPSPAEAEHVIEIFPESQAAPAADAAIVVEPLTVAEPVSSTSGMVSLVAEAVESPSESVTPPPEAALPPVDESGRGVVDVAAASESAIDADVLGVAEPISGVSGTAPAQPVDDEALILSTLLGPESTGGPSSGKNVADEGSAVLDMEQVITAEPASSASGPVYIAEPADAVSGIVMVASTEAEAGEPAAPVNAARAPADFPGSELGSRVPNLELDSKIRKEVASEAEDVDDVIDVAEEASGLMTGSAAAGAEEGAGVFDGEEILDVTEEASSAALGTAPTSGQLTVGPEIADSDVLDAEEVLEGAEASGVASGVDIIAETMESDVDLGGSEEVVVSSGVDLVGPASGGSGKKAGSSPALDEKGIEDLLMGPEEALGGPSSGRSKAEAGAVLDEAEAVAPAAAEEGEEAIAPPPSKKIAKTITPKRRHRRYVLVGILLGFVVMGGVAAGALKYVLDKNKALDAKDAEIAKARQESKKAFDDAKTAKEELVEQQKTAEQETKQYAAKLADSEKTLNALQQAVPGAKSGTPQDIVKAVEAVVKARDKAQKEVAAKAKELAESEQVVDTVATQLKVKRDAVANTVKELIATRSALDGKLKEIDTKLKEAKVEDEGPAGVAKLVDARNKIEKEREDLDGAVKAAFDLLKAENLTAAETDPRKGLLEATKMAVDKARTPLVISQNPEQKLDTWIALLQDRGLNDAGYLNVARGDGQVVLADPRASAEAKAKAQYVMGLADRNRGQVAMARKEVDQAIKAAAATKAGAWAKSAGGTLRELTDTTAYYLPRAERMRASGDLKAALADLDAAVQVNPEDGRLRALRGLVRLEMRPMGPVDPASQKLIRQDAEAARKDPRTAAEGAYVLGRLDEALGNFDGAEKQYRAALEAHKGSPDEASRYIIALARVLQRDRGIAPAAPPVEPEPKARDAKEPKVGRRPAQPLGDAPAQVSVIDPRVALLVAALVGVQAGDEDEDPATAARLRESIELAKRLINSSDSKIKGQGYLLLGQALTRQGKRTEGLQLYTKGMELAYPGAPTTELHKLVEEHPAFQQSEQAGPGNSFLAERHFGKGLHAFWQGQYPAAEEEFRKAVAAYDQDARYQYYLGLSRLLQDTKAKRQQARFNFEVGARLERENRPAPRMVNASLERLQGQLRQYLDDYRQRGQ